ncbi:MULTISPECIES: MerR family transcriptional regulator [Streptomyces]|uniref:MerR family transcriptional regulator n=1 Tax=Streptomyces TaxID=1883 RepID=UPI001424B7A9|nr:MerR family transcriptional regulator [Streptomyces sp. AgN23]AJZ82504.1 MerR family transcriptional regulator [Streptomyces sp. AgN23]WTA83677.1 MerR family transcriptional regulator [Streptomyces antimycoticus]WTB05886.1 MerR family transcriptional regulator [Streptomyces antimycoticus]
MHEELLTIGRFARLCRLSIKQLRHYDETGLLAPVRVDANSGYRYYAPEQARDALTVALLREMDLPLAVIAQALAAEPESRAQILRAERDRLAERISRDQARLEMLERLAEGGLPGYEVTMGREPERRLAVVRAACAFEEIGETFGACVGRLLPVLGKGGIAWEPPLWGLYPLDLEERMEIAVGAQTSQGEGTPGLEFETLPGGPVAETVHLGSYAQLPLAYNALFAAVHERGLRPQAPVREVYLVGPAEAPQEEWTTRLIIPVEESKRHDHSD